MFTSNRQDGIRQYKVRRIIANGWTVAPAQGSFRVQCSFRVHDLRLSLVVSGVICVVEMTKRKAPVAFTTGKTMRPETFNLR